MDCVVHGVTKSRTWLRDFHFLVFFWYNRQYDDDYVVVESLSQSCVTLCNPRDSSPQISSVCGILQARILEWDVISFSKGSSQPRDQNTISCMGKWVVAFFFFLPLIHQVHTNLLTAFLTVSLGNTLNTETSWSNVVDTIHDAGA